MKALLSVRRSVLRFALATLILAGVVAAAFLSTTSVAAAGHTGQALALRAALHPGDLASLAEARSLAAQPGAYAAGTGRFQYPLHYYNPRPMSGTSSTGPVTVAEGVQTYDVFAPPPGFLPGDGPLTPTNLTPVWTSDGRYIIFSSNRPHIDPTGTGKLISDGTFHIWSIAASGDNALDPSTPSTLHEITTSGGNEYFPAIYTATNTELAFVSTAGNGVQNLYAITGGFSAATTAVNVNTMTSLTIRNTGSASDLPTHFGEVDRPTWSPGGDRLAFSAKDSDGATLGVNHLWFLYVNSGGALSNPSGPTSDNPPGKLTDGPASDTDPAWTPDAAADLIAFATNAGSFTAGSPGTPAVSAAPGANRSIYVIKSTGMQPSQITTSGQDDFGPAWNVNSAFVGYLTFARGASPTANHDIDFLESVYTDGVGVTPINPESSTNTAFTINTDDQAMRGGSPGNLFNKIYPSWSPFLGLQAVVYSSNRSVTYNDPTTADSTTGYPGNPVENAISLPQAPLNGDGTTQTGDVGPNYTGLLISRYDDVDPPTLLPYSAGEVIHVTNGTDDKPRRNGDIIPGRAATFTVRLSNREAGIDDNNVYIQIKDPDSKYQDYQGLEHKVFTEDVKDFARNTTPDSFSNPMASVTQGTVSSPTFFLYNGGAGGAFDQFSGTIGGPIQSPLYDELASSTNVVAANYGAQFFPYDDIAEATQTFTFNNNPYIVNERGAVAGQDGGTPISIGRDVGGPSPISITTGNPASTFPLGSGDPAAFKSFGQEYECQYVDANYNSGGATDTVLANYGTPYYLAGVDDQITHTGATHAPPTDSSGNLIWLQLAKSAQQDAKGGVLYTATWTTPTSPSDYYLDVIAYDKATQPTNPTVSAPNWRIYDNIWGFSTQSFQGGKDILVVSDNALGQKFVGSTFGGNGLNNIPPIFYGAESYYTDIDTGKLPNSIYRYLSESGNKPTFNTDFNQPDNVGILLDDKRPVPEVIDLSATAEFYFNPGTPGVSNTTAVFNGLGVDSYIDREIAQQASAVAGVQVPVSQQYSLWRILARGPIDPQVLNAYSGSTEPQPAVNDPLTGFTAPAASVPVNHRCVIWVAPYAGDLPLNTVGSIADGAVQDELRAFVLGGTVGNVTFPGGGRLFMSGASVASALTEGGLNPVLNTKGSFITDVLSASFVSQNAMGGSQNLSGGAENLKARISGDAFFNPDKTTGIDIIQNFFTTATTNAATFVYAAPNSQPLILGNNYIKVVGKEGQWRTDGSLDQLGPVPSIFGFGGNAAESQIGLILPQNGATTDASFNITGPGVNPETSGTGPGLIYNLNLGPSSGRVVFSSFGLEGIGTEIYKYTQNNVDYFFARNQRPNILHNTVCFLRSATVTGTITQGSGGGQALGGATVYLIPNEGVAIPGNSRQTYSALTLPDGSYRIDGVEPGAYFAAAYKAGFNRGETPFQTSVEGDATISFNLNLVPVPPGGISGIVHDASGNPIANAKLTFTSTDGAATVTGTSNADGTYNIPNVPVASYISTVTATGYGSKKALSGSMPAPDSPTPDPFAVNSGATTAGVNFTLTVVPGTLGGVVTDDFTGKPVGGATVTIKDSKGNLVGGSPITTTATAPNTPNDGGKTGDGQPANYTASLNQGTYTVTITPPANFSNPQPTTATVTIASGAFSRQDFTLTSTLGTIAGTITDAGTGKPIQGATVTVTQTDPGANNTQPFTTAADGTYGPAQLAAGHYTATVAAATYRTQTLPAFQITPHKTTPVNAQLVSTLGTFGGLVTDSTGTPLTGATVAITDASGTAVTGNLVTSSTRTSPPDGSGNAHQINFGPVTLPATDANGVPIPYTVTVTDQGKSTDPTKPDYSPVTVTVTLTPGTFTFKPITLSYAYGTLGGLVSDSLTPMAPLAGTTITVADSTGNVVATVTSRNTVTSPGEPLGDTKNQNYSTGLTLYNGAYKVTATATNHSSVTAPVTITGSQFTRADFPLVSTIGTVGGLVLDSNSGQPVSGATVTISQTVGTVVNVVATFTTTGTETPAPAGGTGSVNYSGSLMQGTYSATVTRRGYGTTPAQSFTISPNTFTRVDFSGAVNGLPPIHVFPAGYNFFSVPYDYASIGAGFDQLFGTLNTGPRSAPSPGSNRSHIFVWSPPILQYVLDPTPPADGLHLGQGYWVYLLNPSEVTVAAPRPTGLSVAVTLHKGWNQIGVPSLTPISVSRLTFNNQATGGTISFADASGNVYRLVSTPLYSYNGSTYDAVTASGSLQPWQSYWLYAFTDTSVNIPTS